MTALQALAGCESDRLVSIYNVIQAVIIELTLFSMVVVSDIVIEDRP